LFAAAHAHVFIVRRSAAQVKNFLVKVSSSCQRSLQLRCSVEMGLDLLTNLQQAVSGVLIRPADVDVLGSARGLIESAYGAPYLVKQSLIHLHVSFED
jgi:hypothetical protein